MLKKINTIIQQKKIFKRYRNYLKPSYYNIYIGNKVFFYNNNKNSIKSLSKINKHLGNSMSLSKKIFSKILNIFFRTKLKKDDDNHYNGEIAMITYDKNLKIFDYVNNEVYSCYHEKEKYKKIKEINEYFKNYFNTPYLNSNDDDNVIIEKLIKHEPYLSIDNEERKKNVYLIFDVYYNYVSKINKFELSNLDLKNLKNRLKKEKIFSLLYNQMLPYLKNLPNIPVIRVHGDFNFYNILINKSEINFIDWEGSQHSSFFHDILYLIYSEAFTKNNFTYLKDYLKGAYDEFLNKLFKTFELSYKPDLKINYLFIVMLERIIFYDEFFEEDNDLIDRYIKFMNVLIKEEENR